MDPPPPVAARPPPLPRLAALALLLLSAAAAVTRRSGVRRAEWQALALVGTETPAGTDEVLSVLPPLCVAHSTALQDG